MKRRNRKKQMIAAAGAAVLALNMMACGDSTENSTSNDSTENSTSIDSEQNNLESEVKTDELDDVTIDIFMDSAGENPMTAGIQEDPVAQYIKEQTGVTVNVV